MTVLAIHDGLEPLCPSCEHSLMAIRVSFCSSPPALALGGIVGEEPYGSSDVG